MATLRAVALISLLAAGCGSSGGPAEPNEVLLMVGSRRVEGGAPGSVPRYEAVVMRDDGSGWKEIPFTGPAKEYYLEGATFSSPTTAWVYGGQGEFLPDYVRLLLFKSEDAGFTWTEVSHLLPQEEGIRAVDLAFSNATTGWLYGATFLYSAPIPVFTRDAGVTWEEPTFECDFLGGEGGRIGGLRLCDGTAEVLCRSWLPLGPAPGAENYCKPESPGNGFDVRADGRGVACETRVGSAGGNLVNELACHVTTDHGETWTTTMTRLLDDKYAYTVGDVVLRNDGRSVFALNRHDPEAESDIAELFESRDRGVTWEAASLMPGITNLYGIARSSWIDDR